VRHHVRSLWYFHAVHHSQTELNFFTEYRVHPIDDVFLFTIGVVPLMMVRSGFAAIVAVVWIRHWHTRVYHSNIRSNFGLLRYVLVTPQSHRVHHSIEPRHQNHNFGLTFSIWDHLFGTQWRRYDEYPETGINDLDFPFEQRRLGELGTLLGQLLYPFRALAR
jgi:sterol desaturase/sphingolipid hydroxylase (fatty acid hydroxylase superfamily)